jgi:hypothetical protein
MNSLSRLPERRAATSVFPLIILGSFLLSLTHAVLSAALPGQVDFPLALNTKWTNHLHQEMGEGVHFGPMFAKFAKGNSVDVSVITEVMGTDVINGDKYIRRETRVKDTLWLTEWLRQTPNGLLLGKSLDAEQGQEVLMEPPEKLLSPTLKAGESWDWKAADAPVGMHIKVVGPADLTVPAGTFHTTQLSYDATYEIEGGTIAVRQVRLRSGLRQARHGNSRGRSHADSRGSDA